MYALHFAVGNRNPLNLVLLQVGQCVHATKVILDQSIDQIIHMFIRKYAHYLFFLCYLSFVYTLPVVTESPFPAFKVFVDLLLAVYRGEAVCVLLHFFGS